MVKTVMLICIVCSVVNILILTFVYIYRKEIWYYAILKMGLIGKKVKIVQNITPEFLRTLKEGDKVYERETLTYFQFYNGALTRIDSLMNLDK